MSFLNKMRTIIGVLITNVSICFVMKNEPCYYENDFAFNTNNLS